MIIISLLIPTLLAISIEKQNIQIIQTTANKGEEDQTEALSRTSYDNSSANDLKPQYTLKATQSNTQYYLTRWTSKPTHYESKFVPIKLSIGPVESVAIADIDGDGYYELIGAHGYWIRVDKYNSTSGNVTFMWERSIECNAKLVETADFDNNGKPDIAYMGTSVIGIFNGTGHKLWEITGPFTAMKVHDIDGDTLPEIVAGDKYGKIYLIQHDGTDQAIFTLDSSVKIIKIVDITGDASPEILAATRYKLYVITPTTILWNIDINVLDLAVGDVDNDGSTEILVGGQNFVKSLGTDGSQEWSSSSSNTRVVVGDVDNDGQIEFVISNGSDVILYEGYNDQVWSFSVGGSVQKLLVGQVEGADVNLEIVILTEANIYVINDSGGLYFNQNLAGTLVSVALNNIDSDTGHEILVGSSNGLAYLLEDTGAKKWNYEYSGYANGGMLADDLDDDGKPELIITHSNPNYIAYYDDNLELKWKYPTYAYKLGAEDINNDGYKEIIALDGGNVYALNINGEPLFSGYYSTISDYSYDSKAFDFFDYDNDGHKEVFLACYNYSDYSYVKVVNYTGSIEKNILIPNTDVARTIALADIDSDSQIEVVIGCTSGKIHVLELDGTLLWSFSTGGNIYDIEVSDVDLDGNYEIVAGSVDDKIYVITSIGGLKWSYTVNDDVLDVEVANLDNDAEKEIVASTQSSLYVFDDTGVVKWYRDYLGNTHHVDVGDFNNDGKNEIIIGVDSCYIYIFDQAGGQLYYSYDYVENYFDVGVETGIAVGGGNQMPRAILAKYINASITNLKYNIISTKTGSATVSWTINTNDRILYQEVFINESLYQTLDSNARSVSLSFSEEAAYDVSIHVLTMYFDAWLQVWVIYDKTPPSFNIISPVDNSVVPATAEFNVSFSDNLAGLGSIVFYLNNTLTATYRNGMNVTEKDGWLYTFSDYYVDLTPNMKYSGYEHYYEWELYVPEASYIYVILYHIYLDFDVTLNIYDAQGILVDSIWGNYTDIYGYETGWIQGNKVKFVIENPYLYYWEISIDGYYKRFLEPLKVDLTDDGYWNVTVVVSDAVGNNVSKSIIVRADVTPPTVVINLPDRYNTSSSSLTVNWNADDYWSSIDHYLLKVNVSTTKKITVNVTMRGYNSNETKIISFPNAVKIRIHFNRIYLDCWTVKFYIKDANGNFIANFTTDYYLDYRNYMSPWIPGDTVYLEVQNPDKYLYDIEVDYYEVMRFTEVELTTNSYDISFPSEGVYNVTVVAFDKAGNSNYDSIIVVYDVTPPTGTITSPTYEFITNARSFSLRWEASDALSGYHMAKIYRNGTYLGSVSYSVPNMFNVSFPSEGIYIIVVELYDWAGNVANVSTKVIIDWTSPDIQLFVIPKYPSVDDVTHVVAYVTDKYGVHNVSLVLNNGTEYVLTLNYNASTGYYEISIPPMANGTNVVLSVSAFDAAGNKATSNSYSFIVTEDSDDDGLSDYGEGVVGTDPHNLDSDGDGLPDGWEVDYDLSPLDASDASLDSDNDGLTNLEEYQYHTNPLKDDTDSDGMPDGWEVENNLNPVKNDASEDPDSDKLSNIDEYRCGTNPQDPDSDDDGLLDGEEVTYGCDPLDPDSDDDGVPDGTEVRKGMNPLSKDSDSDFLPDNIDLLPTVPYVDYGIFLSGIFGIFGSVSFVRTSKFKSRLRKWLDVNLDDRFFKVEEVAREAKVPVKYVLSSPIGVVSKDGELLYSVGFLRNALMRRLPHGGVDPQTVANELKVDAEDVIKLLGELDVVRSEKSGWYYSKEFWHNISSIVSKSLGDSFMKVEDLVHKVGVHPIDIISNIPEDVLVSQDENIPLEQRVLYSPKAVEDLRKMFGKILDENGVLTLEEVSEQLGIPIYDISLFVPENAVKSLDGKRYYSVSYVSEMEKAVVEALMKSLEAPVEEVADQLGTSVDDVKNVAVNSRRLALSADMSKIYHEDFVFGKLSEISKQYADIPVEEAAKMIGISGDDLLKLVQRWVAEEYVPIRVSYDRTRIAFIGELRRFLELPEPKGLKFE